MSQEKALKAKSNQVSSNMHFDYVQGRVHGEEQAPAGAAQWAEDGDWKSKAEGEGDSSRHHSQPEHRAGDQQAQQLQKGIYQLSCLHSGHITYIITHATKYSSCVPPKYSVKHCSYFSTLYGQHISVGPLLPNRNMITSTLIGYLRNPAVKINCYISENQSKSQKFDYINI